MATYSQASTFVSSFFDVNGVPLSGGTLSAFLSGTDTPTDMFTDDAGTSAGSIITLNGRGEPEVTGNTVMIFLAEIAYRFILKDAEGVAIWRIDDIWGDGADGGAGRTVDTMVELRALGEPKDTSTVLMLGFYAPNDGGAGTFYWDGASIAADDGGTVIEPDVSAGPGRWLRMMLDNIPVPIFGTVGDGVTDDYAAIALAVAAAEGGSKQIGRAHV